MQRPILKQYGEKRTGTNYLRNLLSQWTEALVLMHALGDKHSVQSDWQSIWEQAQNSNEPAFNFVFKCTYQKPSATSSPYDSDQIAYLKKIAAEVYEAKLANQIGILVSIKNPYAWAVSILRFHGYFDHNIRNYFPEDRWLRFLKYQCSLFNEHYQNWLSLPAFYPGRVSFIPYEELLANPHGCMMRIAEEQGFSVEPQQMASLNTKFNAALWDHLPSEGMVEKVFDKNFYVQQQYLDTLSPRQAECIRSHINWQQLKRFGYTRNTEAGKDYQHTVPKPESC
jgi:hypothetical protein